MAISYEELTTKHPCFARGDKNGSGRIHLPTSPSCNIECRFCERKFNTYEKRPGVASTVITPEEAIEAIGEALKYCPDIHVAGIAGPGDTLASGYALETFRLVKEKYPELVKCMSTNGLLLAEKAQEVIEVGVDSLTVTVNAVDPEIEAQLNDGIVWHGKHYTGVTAAKILIEQQLEGIRLISEAGITVKVNTVLVPEINGEHIEDIARTVAEAGASIYNIIPLIPQHKLKDCREPDCMELERAILKASKYIDVFRHCQRCRADAVGIPGGEDFGDRVYQNLQRLSRKDTFSHG
ncbi:radical SAM protein [Ruminococcus sp.]|uniref:radical SAM protein n=1 Tax=Ruminococcus sp. TaxID=41978 RepID=UPI0025F2C861|nr:radical SAM protein [Ruminococcus sp.]MBQ8965162.1 radical SAM protein [Ruminococcus sp.]